MGSAGPDAGDVGYAGDVEQVICIVGIWAGIDVQNFNTRKSVACPASALCLAVLWFVSGAGCNHQHRGPGRARSMWRACARLFVCLLTCLLAWLVVFLCGYGGCEAGRAGASKSPYACEQAFNMLFRYGVRPQLNHITKWGAPWQIYPCGSIMTFVISGLDSQLVSPLYNPIMINLEQTQYTYIYIYISYMTLNNVVFWGD